MDYTSTRFLCPDCNASNPLRITWEDIDRGWTVQLCDPEERGCDRYVTLRIGVSVEAHSMNQRPSTQYCSNVTPLQDGEEI